MSTDNCLIEPPKFTEPKQIITHARDWLAEDESRWTTGAWCVTADQKSIEPRDVLEEPGLTDEHGGVCQTCLEGALLIFAETADAYQESKRIVRDAIIAQDAEWETYLPLADAANEGDAYHVYRYNDGGGTKASEIIEVLDAAAKIA